MNKASLKVAAIRLAGFLVIAVVAGGCSSKSPSAAPPKVYNARCPIMQDQPLPADKVPAYLTR